MKVVEVDSAIKTVQEQTSNEEVSLTRSVMLTTADNPFNPFTHFNEWLSFDESKGYNTCAYLARIAKVSDALSETEEAIAIRDAIDEIVRLNILGIYRKVFDTGEGSRKDPPPSASPGS